MVARRKQVQIDDVAHGDLRPGPIPGRGDPDGALNQGLAAQRLRLHAVYTEDEPEVRRYPGAVRLAIILGASGGLWALTAGAAHLLLGR